MFFIQITLLRSVFVFFFLPFSNQLSSVTLKLVVKPSWERKMLNRNSRNIFRFLTRPFFHHQRNSFLLPSSTPSSQFTSVTGFDEKYCTQLHLQRNIIPTELKVFSFFNPLRNFLKTRQLGVGIPHHKCYGSMGGVVQRSPRFSELNDDDVKHFQEVLGEKNVIQDEDKLTAANTDWMHKYKGSSRLILQPCNTDQVLLFTFVSLLFNRIRNYPLEPWFS